MSKVRSMPPPKIRRITGGKDPSRIVEEFMLRRGFQPEECLQQKTHDLAVWSVHLSDDDELEISLEATNRPMETTLYLGVNIISVPLKKTVDFLTAALSVADTLIGAKLSLVNYDLVISTTLYASEVTLEEIDYHYELIMRQKSSVEEALLAELES
jgi:hypothetical protein